MGPGLALLRVATVPPLIVVEPVVGALGLVICFHLRLLPLRITLWTVSPVGRLCVLHAPRPGWNRKESCGCGLAKAAAKAGAEPHIPALSPEPLTRVASATTAWRSGRQSTNCTVSSAPGNPKGCEEMMARGY